MNAKEMLQQVTRVSGHHGLSSSPVQHFGATAQECLRRGANNIRNSRAVPTQGLPTRRAGISPSLGAGLAVAAALAVTAFLVRRAARRTEEQHPPSGRFVEVNGVRLHYLESGQGEPVVLLHGNGTHARDFIGSGLAAALAQRYRVIAFDRPGFGYSQRPRSRIWSPKAQALLLRAAFAQLGIDQPIVVGHSWGTMVAIALALEAPEVVRGLLLVSGYFYPTMRWDAVLESPPAIPVLGDVMRYTVSPLLGRLITPAQIRQLFAPVPVPEAFHTEVPIEMMLRPWQLRAAAAEAALMMPAAQSLAARYSELQLPVTLVAGSEDHVVNAQVHTVRLHRELPQSRLWLIPGQGHMPHYAESERLANAVDDLFAECANPSYTAAALAE